MRDAVRELIEAAFREGFNAGADYDNDVMVGAVNPIGMPEAWVQSKALAAVEAHGPVAQAEAAVVDAAERWERIYSAPFDPESASSSEWHKEGDALRVLKGAVRAYRSALAASEAKLAELEKVAAGWKSSAIGMEISLEGRNVSLAEADRQLDTAVRLLRASLMTSEGCEESDGGEPCGFCFDCQVRDFLRGKEVQGE